MSMKKIATRFTAAGVLLSAGAANAAMDVSAVTATVADGVVAAGVIGVAVLGFVAGIAIFKKLRAAV